MRALVACLVALGLALECLCAASHAGDEHHLVHSSAPCTPACPDPADAPDHGSGHCTLDHGPGTAEPDAPLLLAAPLDGVPCALPAPLPTGQRLPAREPRRVAQTRLAISRAAPRGPPVA